MYEFNATDPDGNSLYTHSYVTMPMRLISMPPAEPKFYNSSDYENPWDNNTDNIYESASLGKRWQREQYSQLYVHVTDVYKTLPHFSKRWQPEHSKNQTTYDFMQLIQMEILVYSILYDDANAFDLNATGGILSFIIPPITIRG